MLFEDKHDLLSSFRRIIWSSENKVASEGEAASSEVFCVVPALGGTQQLNIKIEAQGKHKGSKGKTKIFSEKQQTQF